MKPFFRRKPPDAGQQGDDLTVVADDALALRARTDAAAVGVLYDRYADAIYAYCARRLSSTEDAEDATSQVFTRMVSAIPRYTASGSFRSWLFTIAHNVVVDTYRGGRIATLPEAFDVTDPDPSPEDLAIQADDRHTLDGLMQHLTVDQRQVVELRLAGLSGPEIQNVLGRGRSWVDTTQHRAIRRMRATLGIDPPEGGARRHD